MSANIRSAAQFLIDCGLLLWDRAASLQSLPIHSEFNRVCLDPESSYEDVYVTGLATRHFNFCLTDQSYFQFTENGENLRLAYYPNPFVRDDGLLELIDDPVDLEAFELEELRATGGRAPLRFDVAPGQYVDVSHPFAHFHLGHGEVGRLASRRMLCALTFAMIITRLYYPDAWSTGNSDPDEGFSNNYDRRLARLLSANGWVNVAFFSEAEERLIHVR